MNIWIINPYATLPNEQWREDRAQVLAAKLSERGDNIIVWTSNFIHRSKEKRTTSSIDYLPNLKYNIVEVPSYSKHISLKRIYTELIFSKKIYDLTKSYDVPDIIIVMDPAIFYFWKIKDYLKKESKVKLIIDIIDIWPELFNIILPEKIRSLGKIIFYPLYKIRKSIYKRADGIVAVSEFYRKIADRIVADIPKETIYWGMDSKIQLLSNNLSKDKNEFWILYAGTLGNNYDIKTIVGLAEKIELGKENIKLLIAGDGNLKSFVTQTIRDKKLQKTIYLGSLSTEQLSHYFVKSDVGISSYVKDSTVAMPIKIYDYIKYGLPVLNSLEKDLGSLVVKEYIGLQYNAGDVNSIHNALLFLYSKPDELTKMSENMRNIAPAFDYNNQYKKYIDYIDKTIAKN